MSHMQKATDSLHSLQHKLGLYTQKLNNLLNVTKHLNTQAAILLIAL